MSSPSNEPSKDIGEVYLNAATNIEGLFLVEPKSKADAITLSRRAVMAWEGPELGLRVDEPNRVYWEEARKVFGGSTVDDRVANRDMGWSTNLRTSDGTRCKVLMGTDYSIKGLWFSGAHPVLNADSKGGFAVDFKGNVLGERTSPW